jgi:CHASE3 domain sensor protein
MQLEQADKRSQELRTLSSRLQSDNDSYKDRIEQMQQEYNSQLTALETELKAHR